MFFLTSKVLGFIFEPLNALLLAGLCGFALTMTRFWRIGRAIEATCAFVLVLLCFSPISTAALRPLEDRFPSPSLDQVVPTGIIVLGGSIDPDLDAARRMPAIREAAARLTSGVALALRFPSSRLIFTGGSADLFGRGKDEAQGVRRLWLTLGIPANRMVFEDQSRNTYENATMTRTLIRPKPGETWVLVTSAAHMPRSVGIFRKDGWSVVPYPVDYRTFGDHRDWMPKADAVASLHRLSIAMHEWVGLVAYYLSGKTDRFLPMP